MISRLTVYSGLKVAAYSLNLKLSSFCGAPARTRTSNPRLRRPMLYPVELRTQSLTSEQFYQNHQHVLVSKLHRFIYFIFMFLLFYFKPENLADTTTVGAERFELPTPCSQSRCATKLRHTPMLYIKKLPKPTLNNLHSNSEYGLSQNRMVHLPATSVKQQQPS